MKPLKVTVIAQRLAESVFLQKNCGDVNMPFSFTDRMNVLGLGPLPPSIEPPGVGGEFLRRGVNGDRGTGQRPARHRRPDTEGPAAGRPMVRVWLLPAWCR
jgi:hypothetical protein